MDKESQVKPLAPVRLDEVQALIKEAVGGESRLEMLKGFKLDFSGVADFHKVFFSAKCDCGTAALLSIEVSKDKTLAGSGREPAVAYGPPKPEGEPVPVHELRDAQEHEDGRPAGASRKHAGGSNRLGQG